MTAHGGECEASERCLPWPQGQRSGARLRLPGAVASPAVRALRVPEPGAVPEPADLPEPDPAPVGALVRVRAASLNPVDVAIAAGRFYMDVPDPPYVPGAEAAGEVLSSAAHPAGAPVWCLPMTGALAEVVRVAESAVVPLPPGVGFPLAAGLGIAGLAGWMPVRERGALDAGETVVVLGAGGAVGQVAVQAARDGDAGRIVAAARSAGGRERALAAGADVALPTDAGLQDALREACGEGADLVVDILWGEPAVAAIGALRRGGRIVQVGSAAGQVAEVAAGPLARQAARPARLLGLQRGPGRRRLRVRRPGRGRGPGGRLDEPRRGPARGSRGRVVAAGVLGRRRRQARRDPVTVASRDERAAGYGFGAPWSDIGRPMAAPGVGRYPFLGFPAPV